jgi:hypothetical protein
MGTTANARQKKTSTPIALDEVKVEELASLEMGLFF